MSQAQNRGGPRKKIEHNGMNPGQYVNGGGVTHQAMVASSVPGQISMGGSPHYVAPIVPQQMPHSVFAGMTQTQNTTPMLYLPENSSVTAEPPQQPMPNNYGYPHQSYQPYPVQSIQPGYHMPQSFSTHYMPHAPPPQDAYAQQAAATMPHHPMGPHHNFTQPPPMIQPQHQMPPHMAAQPTVAGMIPQDYVQPQQSHVSHYPAVSMQGHTGGQPHHPQQPPMSQRAPSTLDKAPRERKILLIQDPNTNEEVKLVDEKNKAAAAAAVVAGGGQPATQTAQLGELKKELEAAASKETQIRHGVDGKTTNGSVDVLTSQIAELSLSAKKGSSPGVESVSGASAHDGGKNDNSVQDIAARRQDIRKQMMDQLQGSMNDEKGYDMVDRADRERSSSVASTALQPSVAPQIVAKVEEKEKSLEPKPLPKASPEKEKVEETDVQKDEETKDVTVEGEEKDTEEKAITALPMVEVSEPFDSPLSTQVELVNDEEKAKEEEEARRQRKDELTNLLNELKDTIEECNVPKMVYGRKFLYCVMNLEKEFKLTDCPKAKPELIKLGLDIDSMPKEKSRQKVDFSPSWASLNKPTHQKRPYGISGRGSNDGRSSIGRQSQKGGGRYPGGRSSDKREHDRREKLPTSENAWKPTRLKNVDADEETKKREALLKSVRSIMNKITPNTKDELIIEFMTLCVSHDPETLELVINIIFDKAVEEPKFCSLYAELCEKQVGKELELTNNKESLFRNAMLTRSQRVFQAKDQEEDIRNAKVKSIEEEKDEKKKRELQEELAESDAKFRRRKFGNITFIGHLYRHGLLSEKIVKWCLVDLIKHTHQKSDGVYPDPPYDDEQLLCAIRLIETVGKKLESAKEGVEYNNQTLGHLKTISSKCTNKIKFAILNVIELRANKWIPRKSVDTGPKKIEEVHREAELEAIEKEREAQKLRDRDERDRRGGSNLRTGGANSLRGNQPLPSRHSLDNRPNATKTGSMDKRAAAALVSKNMPSNVPARSIKILTNADSSNALGSSRSKWHSGAGGGGTTMESSGISRGKPEGGKGSSSSANYWQTKEGRDGRDPRDTREGSDSRKYEERAALRANVRELTSGHIGSVRRSSSQASMTSTDAEKSKSPPPNTSSHQSSIARSQSPATTSHSHSYSHTSPADELRASSKHTRKGEDEYPTTSASRERDEQRAIDISDDDDAEGGEGKRRRGRDDEDRDNEHDSAVKDEHFREVESEQETTDPSRGETPADVRTEDENDDDERRQESPSEPGIDQSSQNSDHPVRGTSTELSAPST